MYADEVHPHRKHQCTNLTMNGGAEKLQGPVQRLTLGENVNTEYACPTTPLSRCSAFVKEDK